MTLILAAMNQAFVVQVTDRRLTSGNAVVDEEYEKCFSLSLPGFRFSVAFTGLATVGDHSTKIWLMETLGYLEKGATAPVPLLDALAMELTQFFSTSSPIKGLPPQEKTLTVSVVGYNLTQVPPKGLAAEISNATDPNGPFVTLYSGVKDDAPADWTWVGVFGSGGSAALRFEAKIRERLLAGAPSAGVRNMMETMARKAAADPKTLETVGKQLDSIVLYSDPMRPIEGGGSTMVNQAHVRMPSAVIVQPDGSTVAVTDFSIEDVSDEPAPMSVPKVHRNAPCPCGSGKRYKECHREKRLPQPVATLPGLPGAGTPYRAQ